MNERDENTKMRVFSDEFLQINLKECRQHESIWLREILRGRSSLEKIDILRTLM